MPIPRKVYPNDAPQQETYDGCRLCQESCQGIPFSLLLPLLLFSFEKVRAVDDLSIDFELHKITVLLGHNGAGKSTLIGVLTGLFPATGGNISLFGRNVSDPEEMASIHAISGVSPARYIVGQSYSF